MSKIWRWQCECCFRQRLAGWLGKALAMIRTVRGVNQNSWIRMLCRWNGAIRPMCRSRRCAWRIGRKMVIFRHLRRFGGRWLKPPERFEQAPWSSRSIRPTSARRCGFISVWPVPTAAADFASCSVRARSIGACENWCDGPDFHAGCGRWPAPCCAFGEHRTARLVSQAGGLRAGAYWRMVAERQHYARQFLNRLRLGGFDAILTPPYALPVVPHGFALTVLPAGGYSVLPNLLDMPAGVVAATRVRQYEESDRPASRDRCDRAAMRAEQGNAGLPVGVQVIGLPWREDVVLATISALESHFRTQPDYPAQPPV